MSDTDTLARTIWAEARGDGYPGMAAVASVVLNRVAVALAQADGEYWWGSSIAGVCLKPWQFSCWNEDDPNRAKLLAITNLNPSFAMAWDIATLAVAGNLPDSVNGATSYKVTSLPWPHAWGPEVAPVAIVGGQSFYILPTG